MKKFTVILSGLLLIGILSNSCKKDENIVVTTDNITSVVDMLGYYNTDDIDEATANYKSTTLCHCLQIILHENESGEFWPLNITFDFGEENCEFPEGLFRRGKIHVGLTDFWMNEGSVRSLEFEDFYVNEVQILGKKTVTNTGLNDNQNPTWEFAIVGGGIKDTLGNDRKLDVQFFNEMVEGATTWPCYDNVVEVTGTFSGSDNGIPFTGEITLPLVHKFHCRYPVSGEIQVSMGDQVAVVDFGDGECDNKATVKIGDAEPLEITLNLKDLMSF